MSQTYTRKGQRILSKMVSLLLISSHVMTYSAYAMEDPEIRPSQSIFSGKKVEIDLEVYKDLVTKQINTEGSKALGFTPKSMEEGVHKGFAPNVSFGGSLAHRIGAGQGSNVIVGGTGSTSALTASLENMLGFTTGGKNLNLTQLIDNIGGTIGLKTAGNTGDDIAFRLGDPTATNLTKADLITQIGGTAGHSLADRIQDVAGLIGVTGMASLSDQIGAPKVNNVASTLAAVIGGAGADLGANLGDPQHGLSYLTGTFASLNAMLGGSKASLALGIDNLGSIIGGTATTALATQLGAPKVNNVASTLAAVIGGTAGTSISAQLGDPGAITSGTSLIGLIHAGVASIQVAINDVFVELASVTGSDIYTRVTNYPASLSAIIGTVTNNSTVATQLGTPANTNGTATLAGIIGGTVADIASALGDPGAVAQVNMTAFQDILTMIGGATTPTNIAEGLDALGGLLGSTTESLTTESLYTRINNVLGNVGSYAGSGKSLVAQQKHFNTLIGSSANGLAKDSDAYRALSDMGQEWIGTMKNDKISGHTRLMNFLQFWVSSNFGNGEQKKLVLNLGDEAPKSLFELVSMISVN